jgi:hypothetical protein
MRLFNSQSKEDFDIVMYVDNKRLGCFIFLFNLGFENQLRTFSDVIQNCTNWPYCACSDCHDLYATDDNEDDSDYNESDDDD